MAVQYNSSVLLLTAFVCTAYTNTRDSSSTQCLCDIPFGLAVPLCRLVQGCTSTEMPAKRRADVLATPSPLLPDKLTRLGLDHRSRSTNEWKDDWHDWEEFNQTTETAAGSNLVRRESEHTFDADFDASEDEDDGLFNFFTGDTATASKVATETGDFHTVEPQVWGPLIELDDIRVLTIEPSVEDDDMVVCTMERVSLADSPPYQALSYAWNEGQVQHQLVSSGSIVPKHISAINLISCNGWPLSVSPTLEHALKRIRRHWSEGRLGAGAVHPALWVDAICIQQSNSVERSRQVSMMGRIYSKAQCVLVWLGEDSSSQGTWKSTGSLVEDVRTLVEANSDELPHAPQSGVSLYRFPAVGIFHLDDDADERAEAERAEAERADAERAKLAGAKLANAKLVISQLLEREWFRRRWVIQEVFLQSNRIVLLGGYAVPYAELQTAVTTYDGHHFLLDSGVSAPRRPILLNLAMFAGTLCGDARDRIYSLLSISNDAKTLLVDYTKDAAQIYTSFAERYADSTALPTLLACAAATASDRINETLALPSWVPDWSQPRLRRATQRQSYFVEENMANSLSMPHFEEYFLQHWARDGFVRVENGQGLVFDALLLWSCDHDPLAAHSTCLVCNTAIDWDADRVEFGESGVRRLDCPGSVCCLFEGARVGFVLTPTVLSTSGDCILNFRIYSYFRVSNLFLHGPSDNKPRPDSERCMAAECYLPQTAARFQVYSCTLEIRRIRIV